MNRFSLTFCQKIFYKAQESALWMFIFYVPWFLNAATINVPGDFTSIQAAHDSANSGDVVLLQPGVYNESITLTKTITLASLFFTTENESHISSTIIDGNGASAVIRIPSNAEEGIVITGLTIRNGDDGISPSQKFDFLNNIVTGTIDGIDYESGSGGICRNNTFELNEDDGIDFDRDVDIIVEFNTIANNDDDGIEIRLQEYTGQQVKYIIRSNQIFGNGEDGIQLIDYENPTVTDRFFEISQNNIYNNADAGIGCMSNANTTENFEAASIEETVYVFNNTFANNSHGITGGDGMAVVNNIFTDHPNIAVKKVDGNSELAHNIFFNNGTDNSGSNLISGTNLFVDPLLNSALELSAGSPAIDAGVNSYDWQGDTVFSYTASDYSGSARDIGSFEFESGSGTPPDAPTLIAPADGASDVELTPTLSWSGSADIFNLEMATDGGFSNIVYSSLGAIAGTNHSIPVGVLSNSTPYFWRASGSNANGTGPWSIIWTLTTVAAGSPPDAPLLVDPADGAVDISLIPLLSWNGTADNFDVEVATDADFSNVVFNTNALITEVSVSSGALNHQVAYFWRVRGSNSFGTGGWSDVFSFTTLDAPDITPPSIPQNLITTGQTESTISLDWDEATDNVGVTGYNIYRNGNFVGSESFPPHTVEGLISSTSYGFHVTAIDEAGNESDPSTVITVTTQGGAGSFMVNSRVSAKTDDAEERFLQSCTTGSTDLELMNTFEAEGGDQLVGLRFNNINIPQGANVTDAYIQFKADETRSETTSLIIQGEASDNPVTFSSTDGDISVRPRTEASVSWSPPPWTTIGEAGPDQQTSDLSLVLQEIINRPGWSNDNSIVLILSGNGKRTAEAYNGDPAGAPLLTIEYNLANQEPVVFIESPTEGVTFLTETNIDFIGMANDAEEGDLTANLTWNSDRDGEIGTQGAFSTSNLSVGVHNIIASVADGQGVIGADQITITVTDTNTIMVTSQVSAKSDDAEERSLGSVADGSGDLEMSEVVNEGEGGDQIVGMRFNEINIPQGATVVNAFIQFQADETRSVATSLVIQGEASDNPITFSTSDFNISSRPTTTASVAWSPEPWTTVGDADLAQRTPNITSVIQEIISRPGWLANNSVVLVISGEGKRVAESYNGDPDGAPTLNVEYSIAN